MKINDIMTPGVDLVLTDTTLVEIAQKMRSDDVGAIPVGENDRLVGMVTDRDIVIRAVADQRDPASVTARDVMTGDMIWCYDDADVDEAAGAMRRNGVRRIPVVNHDKRLVGMISIGDITRASTELAGDTLRELSAVGD